MLCKELKKIVMHIDAANLLHLKKFLICHFGNAEMLVAPAAAAKENVVKPNGG